MTSETEFLRAKELNTAAEEVKDLLEQINILKFEIGDIANEHVLTDREVLEVSRKANWPDSASLIKLWARAARAFSPGSMPVPSMSEAIAMTALGVKELKSPKSGRECSDCGTEHGLAVLGGLPGS